MDVWIILNNREKALIFWLGIFVFWMFIRKDIRPLLFNVVKNFFVTKIVLVTAIMIVYVSSIILIFSKIDLWDNSLLKDTVFWFMGTAFVLLLNITQINDDEKYFRKLIVDNLKLLVLFQFIVNLYTFSLLIEIIFLPVLFFIAGVRVVAESKDEFKVISDYIFSGLGFFLLFYSLSNILDNPQDFNTFNNFRVFTLPILLTFAYVPFLYFVGLGMTYEVIDTHINIHLKRDQKLARFLKRKLIISCNINFWKLNRFYVKNTKKITRLRDKNDVLQLFDVIKVQPLIKWGFVFQRSLFIVSLIIIGSLEG